MSISRKSLHVKSCAKNLMQRPRKGKLTCFQSQYGPAKPKRPQKQGVSLAKFVAAWCAMGVERSTISHARTK